MQGSRTGRQPTAARNPPRDVEPDCRPLPMADAARQLEGPRAFPKRGTVHAVHLERPGLDHVRIRLRAARADGHGRLESLPKQRLPLAATAGKAEPEPDVGHQRRLAEPVTEGLTAAERLTSAFNAPVDPSPDAVRHGKHVEGPRAAMLIAEILEDGDCALQITLALADPCQIESHEPGAEERLCERALIAGALRDPNRFARELEPAVIVLVPAPQLAKRAEEIGARPRVP